MRNYALLEFGIYLGMRIDDLLQLQVQDVRGQTHVRPRERKTGKRRTMLIAPPLRRLIAEYTANMQPDDYLFPSRNGGGRRPIGRARAYEILRGAGAACGVPHLGTHSLRKTFGYHMHREHKDIELLREIFRHRDTATTARYIGLSQDVQDAAVRKLNLDLKK
jgi:integrase